MNNFFKKKFIELLIKIKVLKFGQFKLISGKNIPYIFDFNNINCASDLSLICTYIYKILEKIKIDFNIFFGASYKGMQIAIFLSNIFYILFRQKKYISYQNKEESIIKTPNILGKEILNEKIILINDIINYGTSIYKIIETIKIFGGNILLFLTIFDSMENGIINNKETKLKAIDILYNIYKIPTLSVINLKDIILYLSSQQFNSSIYNKFFVDLLNYSKTINVKF